MKQFKQFCGKYLNNWFAISLLLAMTIDFVIESLARQSILNGLKYLVFQPEIFIYNTIIIFATLSIVIFFKRRIFTYIVIGSAWLTIGVTNGVILSHRMTPFTVKDIDNLTDGITIITNYFTTKEIILIIVAFTVLFGILASLFLFAPKKKEVDFKKGFAAFMAVVFVLAGSTGFVVKTGIVDTFFGNLAYAYRDYGVPYCFINTWLNTGIKKPAGYSEEQVLNVFDKGELSKSGYSELSGDKNGKDDINIIFLQLESFINPELVNSIELSEPATPNWKQLQKKYSTGYLTVPSVGAGTANTEFETISGMSVKFFGPGEYPYKSILKKQTCESYPYILKDLGYTTHAIHNHRGVFYGRNEVFANLGFDTFTSLEYMSNVSKTPLNWAKDGVITEQITAALDSSKGPDYIYAISVQGHGKYPVDEVIKNPEIKVTSAPSQTLKWEYEYYVNQMYDMDKFIMQLINELEAYDEKIVLVMYGDHLPALEMTEQEMNTGSVYKTEYIMWDNFGMKKKDRENIATYQLTAEIFNRIGIDAGTMTKFHQNHLKDDNYFSNLKVLQYDMLYGERYIYGKKDLFKPVDIKMGINEIKINEMVQIGEKLYIKGENFTECSKISLDGEVLRTIYLGANILGLLEKVDPEDVERMKVSQVDRNSNNDILSTTE
ncbi:MAG: LTA synthase family protein [Eubacteriales bacterium]|nr:LTA synthase family protein [Eubacteriales bacterium]MDD4389358.1 LTA synthase family protein [Eubacteriales bacterium]